MSTMLEQAVIDATALREVALKNAEATVIERYSDKIKEAVDTEVKEKFTKSTDAKDIFNELFGEAKK